MTDDPRIDLAAVTLQERLEQLGRGQAEAAATDVLDALDERAAALASSGRPRPRPELVPATGLMAVASVMAAGADEHGERWREKTPMHHVSAALRHLYRWVRGEPHDPDLKQQGHGEHSHLACAAARALMALDREQDTR